MRAKRHGRALHAYLTDCSIVPLEADGLAPSKLHAPGTAQARAHRPAPDFQNPSVVRYSEGKRDAVAAFLDEHHGHLRLNFSRIEPERLDEGLERLATVVREARMADAA